MADGGLINVKESQAFKIVSPHGRRIGVEQMLISSGRSNRSNVLPQTMFMSLHLQIQNGCNRAKPNGNNEKAAAENSNGLFRLPQRLPHLVNRKLQQKSPVGYGHGVINNQETLIPAAKGSRPAPPLKCETDRLNRTRSTRLSARQLATHCSLGDRTEVLVNQE